SDDESSDESKGDAKGMGKKGKRNKKKREPKEPPLSPEEKARRARETRFLGAIGLAKVTAEVKEHVQTTLGKQVLSRMKLLYDAEQIAAVLEQTREMMRLSKMLPFEDLHDPSVLHDRVQNRDRPLDPREMRKLGGTLAAARDVKAFLEELSEESAPRLRALAAHLDPVPELLEALERSISQDGRVHVRASERLEAIRTRLRALNDEIHRNLEGMIREQGIGLALHSLRPVMRKDRFVLAVKGPKAGEVEGEVVTKAKGGGIVYKEPAAIKQLNDEQLTLGKEEKAEQRRILGELTQLFRDAWERIERTANTLGWIDFTQAKALFALQAGFWVPQLSEGALELKDAFHPLIAKARKKDGAGAVTFSLTLGSDHDVALISGPKSGGKTVTLRTIGLCAALAQSGMPIPASEESKLPVFQGLYADIAEGRAGPAGRSAFSLHLTRIKEVLAEADERSLILLDELGNGTEPGEAAALAQAALEALVEKKAKVAAVTHLPALKQFAFSHARAENFALGWDSDEGKPSYALSQGQPGSSFSLESARRAGVPAEVMSRAETLLGEQDRLGEELTAHLRTLIGQAEQRSADATAKQKEAQEAVAAVERERKSIDATKQAISKEADLEMEERFLKLQRVVRKAVEEL
ncbi:MAG TPA: hypothetical protein DEA08_18915, partial [Planctomycetes bacterium]|nr:hypothetical protein [Planctomycetota bacterium]